MSSPKKRLRLVGRVRLTPGQCGLWLTLTGAVPGGVTTVEQLLQWVRLRKAGLAAQEPGADHRDGWAAMDALFEWCTGEEMPDPPLLTPPEPEPPKVRGGLVGLTGGRRELERELVALVLTGRGDEPRAQELSRGLGRRSWRDR